uniref:Uncharacterized protein n=2 Tax=Emiliania huxleyi TaxID=2903 RepID=A0A0D3JP82_EMIH1
PELARHVHALPALKPKAGAASGTGRPELLSVNNDKYCERRAHAPRPRAGRFELPLGLAPENSLYDTGLCFS